MAAVFGYAEPLRILCTREFQASIKESFHAELKNAIMAVPWLESQYSIGVDYIRGKNGTEFIFRGLRHNIASIKSLSKIDLCIVEEANDIPEYSWKALLPTVRSEKSEIWAIYNPKKDTDPVDVMFRQHPPPRSMVVELNWQDNPFFPPELEEQRKYAMETMNPADYAWIWDGQYLENSDAQVLAGKLLIQEFEPNKTWKGPYYGADWGFSVDPTAAVKLWIKDQCLYVEYEAYKVGLELDDTAEYLCKRVPGIEKRKTRSDSARPETISYLKRHGLPFVEGVKKWAGSIEDGIQHLRSFKKIVVHPRCENTIREVRLYSYKVDRLTGDVLPDVEDKNNHIIDSIRYALAPMIAGVIDYSKII